jgi:hypothetical protein
MTRKVISTTVVSALRSVGCLCLAPAAGAATTRQLFMSQSAAFAVLGHWCGGISEQVYATGFGPKGYPTGAAHLQTTCSSGGRGSRPTTYTGWGSVTWDWFGETRSYARLQGAPSGISTTFSAKDAHGDRIYNIGTAAYLETTKPPIVPPAAPTGVTGYVSATEVGEQVVLRLQVGWTPAPETAGLITSSTVTATPVGSTAPVLKATANGAAAGALLSPLQFATTYRITVTNTDPEGTSHSSTPIEVKSPGSDEEPADL